MFQLARCGEADATDYFRRVAILYQPQVAIIGTGTMAGVRDSLLELGADWGLAEDQVMASLTDRRGAECITRSIEDASRRGATGTPAFFVGNERISNIGFFTTDGLACILDARLAAGTSP